MNVKVCGITDLDQFHALAGLGVSYAGFIFYPPSPRCVSRRGLSGQEVKRSREKLSKVGVFVNATYDEVMRRIDEFGLDMVQLHGHETPYECDRIAPHIDVIKAFRFAENDHVMWMIKDFYECVDMFLMDTGIPAPKEERENPALHGGIGRKFNWSRLRDLKVQKPFLLSGGIEPGDAGYIREFLTLPVAKDCVAIDINSRFEIFPGIKDLPAIGKFMTALRQA